MTRILRTASRYFIGLDLGQKRDYTAIAILEQAVHTYQDRDPVTFSHLTETVLSMRHAERIPLGTPYPEVIFRVLSIAGSACLNGPITLVVDATGLGAPVVDHLRRSKLRAHLEPLVFTAQLRRDLIANLQFLFDESKLDFAHNIRLLDAVIEELAALRSDGTQARHDDLAFALALAAWPARARQIIGEQPHPLPIYFSKDPRKCA